jgi:hypothetical protein
MVDILAGLSGGASGAATGALVGGVPGAAIGGAIGVIGGLMSSAKAAKSEKEAERYLKEARDMILNIQTPEQKAAVYEELKVQGLLTPQFEKDIAVADTEMKKIILDPRYKEAQLAALKQMQDLGKSGGLDDMDRFNIEQAQQRALGQAQAQRAQTTEEMARRGMGTSGLAMLQSQMAGQGAANAQRQAEMQVQAEARRRALESILKGGQLAGDIRGQEFGEESQKAQAQDLINRFNVQNQIGSQQRNIDRTNIAQEANLRAQQAVANANVGIRNTARDINRTAGDIAFEQQLSRAQAASGTATPLANFSLGQAQGTRDQWGNLLESATKGVSAYSDYKKANPDPKVSQNTIDYDKEYNRG